MSGYFGVGIENVKIEQNIGTLWRTAHAFDVSLLAVIGRRYTIQASDTTKAMRSVPLQHYSTFDEFHAALPVGCRLVGIELDPKSICLREYHHPAQAFYLLGSEDHGLSHMARSMCHDIIKLPGKHCLNVAVAGSIVLAHRIMQQEREAALEAAANPKVLRQLVAHV